MQVFAFTRVAADRVTANKIPWTKQLFRKEAAVWAPLNSFGYERVVRSWLGIQKNKPTPKLRPQNGD
jgi:hypothetical protein